MSESDIFAIFDELPEFNEVPANEAPVERSERFKFMHFLTLVITSAITSLRNWFLAFRRAQSNHWNRHAWWAAPLTIFLHMNVPFAFTMATVAVRVIKPCLRETYHDKHHSAHSHIQHSTQDAIASPCKPHQLHTGIAIVILVGSLWLSTNVPWYKTVYNAVFSAHWVRMPALGSLGMFEQVDGSAGLIRWCNSCRLPMHTRWWHCDDGDFDFCGLRTISRCLPWYHHACPWVGGPIYAANLKAYLIALALLPVYTAVLAVVAVWSLADSSIREASNVVLVISALIPVFNSCYYSWEISSWAWKAAIKHNRLPLSECDMTIRIRTRNPVTGEHGVEDFMTELHENAFSCCSWRTHFWLYLGPTWTFFLLPFPVLNLIALFVPSPLTKYFESGDWDDFPWPQGHRIRRILEPESSTSLSSSAVSSDAFSSAVEVEPAPPTLRQRRFRSEGHDQPYPEPRNRRTFMRHTEGSAPWAPWSPES